ncbi:MFS transporter [Planktotalea sp.]|uniref:MFS transporter n=1 Tax=Planktotalea sp. TaxID=2029877 RepID=UPI0035C7B559
MSDFRATSSARLATRLAFFAAGFAMACCAPLFPFMKAAVGANEGLFGVLLLCLGIGAVSSMPATGIVAARYGARGIMAVTGVGLAVMLPLLAFSTTPWMLGASLFVFGASLGSLDVAMNIHGTDIEEREARSLMSNFHAHFSIGGGFGAGLITLQLWAGMPYQSAALVGAAVTLVTVVLYSPRLLRAKLGEPAPLVWPKGIVLLLAAIAAITFLVEGAVLDWGALLLIQRELAEAQTAGVGYIVFSITMVFARLTGDQTIERFGALQVFITGGFAAMAGIIVILIAPSGMVALVGFGLIGLGAANLVPIVFSAAGRQRVMPPSLAVAAVTTVGYAGILLGPALIGGVAALSSLAGAFWLLAALMICVPLAAKRVTQI